MYEAFDTVTDLVASQIRKRQLETSQSEQKATRRKYDNEEGTTNGASSDSFMNKSTEEKLPNRANVRSITENNGAVEVIYDELSLWLSNGSSSIPETNTEPSLPSMEFTEKFFWYLSICGMGIIVTDKVEMNTTDHTIKTVYDEAHNE